VINPGGGSPNWPAAQAGALRATSSVPWRLGERLVLACHAALLACSRL